MPSNPIAVSTNSALLLQELFSKLERLKSDSSGTIKTTPPRDLFELLEELVIALPETKKRLGRIQPQAPPLYLPLEQVSKPYLTTRELSYYSNLAEQTWRVKACYDTAPEGLRPLRVFGKLAWPTAGAKKLLGVA